MKNYKIIAKNFLVIVLLFSAFVANASHHEEEHGHAEEKKDDFNPTEMIMHHIKDAHEFHVAGDFSVALPIILWVDGGLVTFSSSEFKHSDDGSISVKIGEQSFAKIHEKIYLLDKGEDKVIIDHETHHPENAHEILLDFSITKNIFSMFMSAILLLVIFMSLGRKYKKRGIAAPKGSQTLFEALILFVKDDIAKPNIGEKKHTRYMPYLLTVFFFIWINNLIGLIPFFPFSANLTGNIGFTLTLALITFLITQFSGNKHYWGHILWMPGVPVPMKIIMAPIELVGILTKPIALMIRLFANITAGHIIILSLFSIIFIFKDATWASLSAPLALFMNVLELLVAFLQAYVFTLLSALFIGQAVEDHH